MARKTYQMITREKRNAQAQRAVAQAVTSVAGGAARLAKALGITQSAISQWECVRLRHVRTTERLTGTERHGQRLDVYDPPLEPG